MAVRAAPRKKPSTSMETVATKPISAQPVQSTKPTEPQTTNQTAGQTTNRITRGTDQKKPDTYENGLISCVIADDLQFKTHDGRLKHNPNTYGKLAEDHAGHLIGDQFGGSPELDNLVSQAKNVNMSEYKVIENQWAAALKNGQKVSVRIDVKYDAGNTRPTSFVVSYEIDGAFYQKRIKN